MWINNILGKFCGCHPERSAEALSCEGEGSRNLWSSITTTSEVLHFVQNDTNFGGADR